MQSQSAVYLLCTPRKTQAMPHVPHMQPTRHSTTHADFPPPTAAPHTAQAADLSTVDAL